MSNMSYVFVSGDNQLIIWSPALQTGALFVAVCDVVSRSLAAEHGLVAEASDYITIHGDVFAKFVSTWLNGYTASDNTILQMEWRPFLLLSVALLQRLDKQVVLDSNAARSFIADAEALLRNMPHA